MAEIRRKTLDAEASSEPYWRAPWEFAVHAIVGTLIFTVIGGVAVGLDVAIRALASYGVSAFITYALKSAEYAVFLTDLVLFAVFLWRTAARAVRKL